MNYFCQVTLNIMQTKTTFSDLMLCSRKVHNIQLSLESLWCFSLQLLHFFSLRVPSVMATCLWKDRSPIRPYRSLKLFPPSSISRKDEEYVTEKNSRKSRGMMYSLIITWDPGQGEVCGGTHETQSFHTDSTGTHCLLNTLIKSVMFRISASPRREGISWISNYKMMLFSIS